MISSSLSPFQHSKKPSSNILATNNEEIARLANLNNKILKCLDRIDQQEQDDVASAAQHNSRKVCFILNCLTIAIFLDFYKFSQAPTCWSELPERIWLRVFQNLEVKDVNTVHLVCRSLHQIANLQVNSRLKFDHGYRKDLESLVRSSRVFEELTFEGTFKSSLCSDDFAMIEELISFTGIHVKKLIIRERDVDLKTVQKLLNLLPNLKSLEIGQFKKKPANKEPIKWDLRSTKIERVYLVYSIGLESLLEALEKCAIKEVKYHAYSNESTEILGKFLKSQEKNLKKLFLVCYNSPSNLLMDLKELRLEHFKFDSRWKSNSLEFLKQQIDLKYLKISTKEFSIQDLNTICELKNLESLELEGWARDRTPLSKLHKLQKLKRLNVHSIVGGNIFEHLQFGVFHSLEELHGNSYRASVESIREMKRTTPKLKKIELGAALTSDAFSAVLESLEDLEYLEVSIIDWEITEKVYPKIKQLDMFSTDCLKSGASAEMFTKVFPNLEYLRIKEIPQDPVRVTESFFITLLTGLKQLKSLHLNIHSDTGFYCKFMLPCFRKYGKHLEEVDVSGFVIEQGSFEPLPKFELKKEPGNRLSFTDFTC